MWLLPCWEGGRALRFWPATVDDRRDNGCGLEVATRDLPSELEVRPSRCFVVEATTGAAAAVDRPNALKGARCGRGDVPAILAAGSLCNTAVVRVAPLGDDAGGSTWGAIVARLGASEGSTAALLLRSRDVRRCTLLLLYGSCRAPNTGDRAV